MKTSRNRLFLLSLFICLVSGSANALSDAAVIVSVFQPVPAVAGEKLAFRTTFLNTGTEPLARKEYEHRIVFYDANKSQVKESDRVFGANDVPLNTLEAVSGDFTVPKEWEGQYYYKPVIKTADRVAEGDIYSIWIEKRETMEPKKPLIGINNGTLQTGYQLSTKYSNLLDYRLDLGGDSGRNSYSINASGRYLSGANVAEKSEVQDILLTYKLPKIKIQMGDVNPAFSEYTLNYRASRGLSCEYEDEKVIFSVLKTNTAEPQASTGVYGQNMHAGRLGYKVNPLLTASLNYADTADERKSLSSAGSAPPVSNRVLSLVLDSVRAGTGLSLEVAQSRHDADITNPGGAGGASAVNFKAVRAYANTNVGVRIAMVPPGFYDLANESITNDRMIYGFSFSNRYREMLALSFNAALSNDNLRKLSDVPTTIERDLSFNVNTTVSGMPRLSAGVALRSKYSNEVYNFKTNDSAVSGSLGIAHAVSRINVSFNGRFVRFRDKSSNTGNSDTDTLSLNASMPLAPGVSAVSGAVYSSARELAANPVLKNNSAINCGIERTRDRITSSLGLGTSINSSSDRSSGSRLDNVNAGASYVLDNIKAGVNIGLGRYSDEITAANSYFDNSLKLSLTYSF